MLKVPGLENPADLVTKHLNRERIKVYVDLICYRFESGRATTMADLHMLRGLSRFGCGSKNALSRFPLSNTVKSVEFTIYTKSRSEPFKAVETTTYNKHTIPTPIHVQEAKHWECLSALHWRGEIPGCSSA